MPIIIIFHLLIYGRRCLILFLLNITLLLQNSKVIDIFSQRILGILILDEVIFKNVELVIEVIKFHELCDWDRTIALFHGGDQLQFVARDEEDLVLVALALQQIQILEMLVDLLEVNIIGIAEHHVHVYGRIQDLGPEPSDSVILLFFGVLTLLLFLLFALLVDPHFLISKLIFLLNGFVDVLFEALNYLVELVLRHVRSSDHLIKRIETAQEFVGVGANVEDSYLASADFPLAVLLALDLLVALLLQHDEVLRDVGGVLHLVHVHVLILVDLVQEHVFDVNTERVLFEELLVPLQNLDGLLEVLDRLKIRTEVERKTSELLVHTLRLSNEYSLPLLKSKRII